MSIPASPATPGATSIPLSVPNGPPVAEPMPAMNSSALLRLMHLVSPTLPIGSFAFSQGLEWAIEHGGQNSEEKLFHWWRGLLGHGLGCTDAPVLLRLHAAWAQGDEAGLRHWNQRLLATRETQELLDEDRQVGRALMKLLTSLDLESAREWLDRDTALATGWALASVRWQIPPVASVLAYLWAWLDNQVVAAGKLLPLPQTAAQRLLLRLSPEVEAAAAQARLLDDDEVGQSLPGWSLASARHETQYSRLFRS